MPEDSLDTSIENEDEAWARMENFEVAISWPEQ